MPNTRKADPENPRTFEEVPYMGEFTRKVMRMRVKMVKTGSKTARLIEDVPGFMRGEVCPAFPIPPLELMLD